MRRRPLGERLVQPEVVPPLHGDEVAEPHVGELVQDRDDAALLDGVGHLGAEHVGLGEGDRARVLHRAGVELRHEELVVLLERVRRSRTSPRRRRSPGGSSRRCSRRRGTRRSEARPKTPSGMVRPSLLVSSRALDDVRAGDERGDVATRCAGWARSSRSRRPSPSTATGSGVGGVARRPASGRARSR